MSINTVPSSSATDNRTEVNQFWAITCYFNPMGWQRRLHTYKIFRAALSIPLLAVELGFDGRLDLEENDADILIQIPRGDIMWQKERLLNLALTALPTYCNKIAWLDCDVIFSCDKWIEQTLKALDKAPLVQLFRQVHYLGPDWQSDQNLINNVIRTRPSLAAGVADGYSVAECLVHPSPNKRPGTYANGMAWAARRDILKRHGFFDASIIGGGDRAISCAAYGCYQHLFDWHRLNARQKDYYLQWAEPFYTDCQGQVEVLNCDIYHVWHGTATNRGLGSRHLGLAQFDFDPFTDIALDANGCWCWSSEKPALHNYLRKYFQSRREDG